MRLFRGCGMNSELIDKIYESCFAPQVWPEVLDEVGRIGDAPGASLFFSRGGDQRCVTSAEPRERAERIVREGWLARGAIISRLFAQRHAGFRALLDWLKTIEIAHPEAPEPISKAFGYDNWNILSAKIKSAEQPASDERTPPVGPQNDQTTLYCTFCGKSQHEVRKLVAGPTAFIGDECVDLCTNIIETGR